MIPKLYSCQTLVIFYNIIFSINASHEELFGYGTLNIENSVDISEHITSSTEDLIELFKTEKKIAKELKENMHSFLGKKFDVAKKFIESIDYE